MFCAGRILDFDQNQQHRHQSCPSYLLKPVSEAGTALVRIDERIARSDVGSGWIGRSNIAEACASLWIDGEFVILEDLVLHDASHDIRTPTHELTIARDVLRSRRRIPSLEYRRSPRHDYRTVKRAWLDWPRAYVGSGPHPDRAFAQPRSVLRKS